jgi:hypothetical protein
MANNTYFFVGIWLTSYDSGAVGSYSMRKKTLGNLLNAIGKIG